MDLIDSMKDISRIIISMDKALNVYSMVFILETILIISHKEKEFFFGTTVKSMKDIS